MLGRNGPSQEVTNIENCGYLSVHQVGFQFVPLLGGGTAIRGLGSADALFIFFQNCVLTINCTDVEDFKL